MFSLWYTADEAVRDYRGGDDGAEEERNQKTFRIVGSIDAPSEHFLCC